MKAKENSMAKVINSLKENNITNNAIYLNLKKNEPDISN